MKFTLNPKPMRRSKHDTNCINTLHLSEFDDIINGMHKSAVAN